MANEYGIGFWGQGSWGENSDAYVSITGIELNTTLNSVSISAEINSGWGRLTWGQNDWGGEGLSVSVALTGQELIVEEGIVDPNPDVILEGQELIISLESVNITADGLTDLTGHFFCWTI